MVYLFKELGRHRWRTIAGISGYLLATLFIMLILSLTTTNENNSVGILKGTGTHFIVYIPAGNSCCPPAVNSSMNGSLVAEGGYAMMLNSDLIYTLREIEGIKDAAPYLLYKIFDKNYNTDITLGGIDTASYATMTNVCAPDNLISGRYLSGKPGEVVVEESFAKAHMLEVGDTLNTYGVTLFVGGIINSGIRPGKADLYAPIGEVRSILKNSLNCISDGFDMNIVLVEVEDARIQSRVISQIKSKMNFLSVSSYNCYQPASEVINIMEGTSSILSVVVLIFLLIFSVKTQLTNLLERYREIGILKSLGWSDSRLSFQIISGSVLQALTGSIIGVLTGILVISVMNSRGIKLFSSFDFLLQPELIPALLLLSVGGGLIASLWPVVKLHRMSAGEMINSFN